MDQQNSLDGIRWSFDRFLSLCNIESVKEGICSVIVYVLESSYNSNMVLNCSVAKYVFVVY